jgi:hypothetical protein
MSDEPLPVPEEHYRTAAGVRPPPVPPPIIMHAPEGLRGGSPAPRPKRSEWISVGALGATLLGVMAATETIHGLYCSPNPQANSVSTVNMADATAVNTANTNTSTSCRSYHSSHTSFFSSASTSSSPTTHFNGFGETGSIHISGIGA